VPPLCGWIVPDPGGLARLIGKERYLHVQVGRSPKPDESDHASDGGYDFLMTKRIFKIQPVTPLELCNPDCDGIDVILHLTDGRMFQFEVATPNVIYEWMRDKESQFLLSQPQVFVEKLTFKNISDAFQELIQEENNGLFDALGTAQVFTD
jgi:hypothetical protein